MENPNELKLDELSAEGDAPPPADAAPDAVEDGAAQPQPQTQDQDQDQNQDQDQDKDQDEDDDGPLSGADLKAVYDVPVQVSAVLGKATLRVSQLLKLGRGAVVELDRKVGEAIDIYINDRLVARGEVVVVEDRLGVTMTEIIKSDSR